LGKHPKFLTDLDLAPHDLGVFTDCPIGADMQALSDSYRAMALDTDALIQVNVATLHPERSAQDHIGAEEQTARHDPHAAGSAKIIFARPPDSTSWRDMDLLRLDPHIGAKLAVGCDVAMRAENSGFGS
jgi:hypothetical protein